MQHVIEQVAAAESSVFLDEFFGEVEHDADDASAGDEYREGVQQQCGAAEFLDVESHLGHEF